MIQFICISFLFFIHNNFLDIQFLYQDIFLILPLSIFMAYTGASETLSKQLPPGALVSVKILSSIVGQILIQMLGIYLSYWLLYMQDFYENTSPGVNEPEPTYENTVLFLVSVFQIVWVCVCFNVGPPFRKSAFSNFWFTVTIILVILLQGYLVVYLSLIHI